VEGAAEKNPIMQRCYSRDHRPDGEPMVIAPIVNREGFPLSYETFDGNLEDVSTMENDFAHGGVTAGRGGSG
jgi:transposase